MVNSWAVTVEYRTIGAVYVPACTVVNIELMLLRGQRQHLVHLQKAFRLWIQWQVTERRRQSD